MAYSPRILRQLGHPSGFLGRLVLRRLNRVNRGMNASAHAALDPGDGDRVLEIGFGGGCLIDSIMKHDGLAFVAGAEISNLAVQAARRRFAEDIAVGRLEIQQCGEATLPFSDAIFSSACCVNVIYFWPDVRAMLVETHRVLCADGVLVLVYVEGAPDTVATLPSTEVEEQLLDAGFASATTTHHSDRENGRYHCTIARKAAHPKPEALKLVITDTQGNSDQ